MTARELIKRRAELELLLKKSGPVQFVRDLTARSSGAQILAQEARQLGDHKRSTRFLYRDRSGGEVAFTVVTEEDTVGQPQYWLQVTELA